MGTQGGRQAPVSPGCVEVLMDIIVEKYTIGLPVLGEKSWKNAIVFVVVSSYNHFFNRLGVFGNYFYFNGVPVTF